MLPAGIGEPPADQQEIVTVLIRTLVREWISGRSPRSATRASRCATLALLACLSASSIAAAGELPKLEALLKQKSAPKAKPVPARVQQESLFDIVDPQWEKPAVPVKPTEPTAEQTAKLEPIPASAADLIDSIESDGGPKQQVTRALPQRALDPPKQLKPAPPVAHHGPALAVRQPAPAAEASPANAPKQFVLGSVEVEKLIARARKELQAGDVAMAHAFAEAAAETEIPLALFEQNAGLLIDEVEIVRKARFEQAVAWQDAELPAPGENAEPETLADTIEQQPHVWRALVGPNLMSAPPLVDRDGSRQELPEARGLRLLSQVPQMNQTMGAGRGWEPISYSWEAPALKYNPLYFEDPQLERHGNEIAYIQPAISAGRFFATIPTLPYQMAIEDNSVCHTVYDLGNDRPGDCVPYSIPVLPFSVTGALTQGGAATALIFILP
jgi:hypothetical protein